MYANRALPVFYVHESISERVVLDNIKQKHVIKKSVSYINIDRISTILLFFQIRPPSHGGGKGVGLLLPVGLNVSSFGGRLAP